MKKITILCLHLGYGGIEKAISSLANLFCDTYDITIVSTYKLYDKPAFVLDKNIKVEYLICDDLAKRVENYKVQFLKLHWLKLWKSLFHDYFKKGKYIQFFKDGIRGLFTYKRRKEVMASYIKNCHSDIIISTRDFHNLLLSKYGNKECYKIGWEHNHHNDNSKYIHKVVHSAKNLDALVLVSKELFKFYKEKLEKNKVKCYYIPNFIDYIPQKKSDVQKNRIVTVGRLSPEKGHLDLIDVVRILSTKTQDFHLDIVGSGTEREKIEEKIKEYHLQDYITMHGFLNKLEMKPILEEASVFVLPSYTESFGLVILEAFAYGIPSVAFDSAQGASEIIENGWDGYLIKNRDKEQMAKRILELLKSYNRRVVMGNNACKKAKQYTDKVVKKDWDDLFERE